MNVDYAQVLELGSATLHEAAGREGALRPELQAVAPSMQLAGPAYPVQAAPGDNLWIHRAIYRAAPGDVLVVATGDDVARWGYWGEIMSEAASARGLGGLVLEGGSRDSERLAEIGFPVFSLGRCIRGTGKDPSQPGSLGEAVHVGETLVSSGDLIVGDADGVLALHHARAAEVVAAGIARAAKEREVVAKLRAGATTLDLYDLPPAPQ